MSPGVRRREVTPDPWMTVAHTRRPEGGRMVSGGQADASQTGNGPHGGPYIEVVGSGLFRYFPTQYKCPRVRMKRSPSTIAGVAMQISFILFVASSSYLSPALTTCTSPSSFVK